jgi:hypothetical protein
VITEYIPSPWKSYPGAFLFYSAIMRRRLFDVKVIMEVLQYNPDNINSKWSLGGS